MNTKTDQLNNLFDEWERNYSPYKGKLTRDGIINELLFNEKKAKEKGVLFIAKEPNDKDQSGWDFRKWWNDEPLYRSFSHRLAEWGYGVTNDFPEYWEATENRKAGITSIAFMNLKKSGGTGTANDINISKAINETSPWLLQEIEIIDPDIIIGCGLLKKYWKGFLEELKWIPSGFDTNIAMWNNIKIIDYWHPSNRYPRVMNYCTLGAITKSNAFKEL